MNNYNNTQTQGHELNWNGTITQDAQEYTPLENGYYLFQVAGFNRARTEGKGKLPPCPMAKLTLQLFQLDATPLDRQIGLNLILHTSLEWKLSEFFVAIGQKEKGQPLIMNWNNVLGARGVCEIGKRENNGKMYDDVKKCLDKEEAKQKIDAFRQQQTVAQPQQPTQPTNDYPW